jgi:hypothetical protein
MQRLLVTNAQIALAVFLKVKPRYLARLAAWDGHHQPRHQKRT